MSKVIHYKIGEPATRRAVDTAKEWALCLLSREHAATTWLRITDQQEQKALRMINNVLYLLAGAIVAVAFFAARQYYFFHDVTVVEYNDATVYVKPKQDGLKP